MSSCPFANLIDPVVYANGMPYQELKRIRDDGPVPVPAAGDAPASTRVEFVRFDDFAPGRLNATEYDAFVRDLVNFLDYVGEPAKAVRISVGVWVILFLLAFTGIAYLLKQEYWKDVK